MHGGFRFRTPGPAAGLRNSIPILILLLLCLPYPLRSSSGLPSASVPDYLAAVTVDTSAPGQRIPNGFLGLSYEWEQARRLVGEPGTGINAIYRQLLSNLIRAGAGHLVIRIGGPVTDGLKGSTRPDMRPFTRLFRDFSEPEPQLSFILGVNLAARNPGLAVSQTRAYLEAMPAGSVTALEIGYEPDTYPQRHYRSRDYRLPDYLADFRYIAEAIRKALPAAPGFAGPSLSPAAGLNIAGFEPASVFQESARLDGLTTLSLHAYAASGTACGGDPQPGILLQAPAATAGPERAALLGSSSQTKKGVRITEMNGLSCSEPGISDSFESALWLTDILFGYAQAGVSGINLHTNNRDAGQAWDPGSPFLFDISGKQYDSAGITPRPDAGSITGYALKSVQPMYYGMLLFAEGAPAGSALLPAVVKTDANVRAWATRNDATGEVKVVLINKELNLPGRISLSVPGYRSGKIGRYVSATGEELLLFMASLD